MMLCCGFHLFSFAFAIFYENCFFIPRKTRYGNCAFSSWYLLFIYAFCLPKLCTTGGCVWDNALELVAMVKKNHGVNREVTLSFCVCLCNSSVIRNETAEMGSIHPDFFLVLVIHICYCSNRFSNLR